MRILVTGSSGFVGSHLVEALIDRGHEVRVLLRPGGSLSTRLSGLPVRPFRAGYDDTASLRRALRGTELVFHAGGITIGRTAEEYHAANAGTTAALLEAGSTLKTPPRRFVLVSSHAMMGPATSPDRPSKEDDVPMPVEAYGRSKLAAELIARAWSHRIPVTIIRPPSVYGPRDRDFLKLFKQIQKHINLFYGNAKKYTGLVYIDDLIEGMLLAAFSPAAENRAYFITGSEGIRWDELQGIIAEVGGCRTVRIPLPGITATMASWFGTIRMRITKRAVLVNREKVRMAAPKYWCLSSRRAEKELGFRARTDVEEGIRRTWEWYRDQGWL